MCAAFVPAGVALGVLRKAPALGAVLFVSGTGALVFAVYNVYAVLPLLSANGETATVKGVIVGKTEYAGDLAAYTVRTEIKGVPVKIQMFGEDVAAEYGDAITFEAKLRALRDNALFPERSYNRSKGILLGAQPRGVIETESAAVKTPVYYILKYNEYIKGKITAAFPNDTGGLLCAIFLGDTSLVSPGLDSDIKISGTAHYTAVSGLHLTLISHFFLIGLGLTPLKNKRRLKFVLLLCIILVFMVFFNLSKSVARARIMLIVCYGGELFYRKGSVFNSLGFALLVILILEPYACLDAGLILSVAGTFGVGVLAPALAKRKGGRFFEASVASVCASLCVLPPAALYFKGMSVTSPLTSVILSPFFSVAAVALIIFAIIGGNGGFLLLTAGIMSKIMEGIIRFFGGMKAAWVNLDYAFVPYWIMFAGIAVFAVWLFYKNAVKAVKAAVIAIGALAVMICSHNALTFGETYLEIRSDGTAGWAVLRRGKTQMVVVTADGPKAYSEINAINGDITLLCLLGSSNNALPLYEKLPAGEFVPPGSPGAVYDISGKFTLETREGEAVISCGDYTVALSPAKNDRDSYADLTAAYGWVKNRRDMNSGLTVYVSGRMDADNGGEINAYYENARFLIGESK
jgi:ComEC/Rec2-related protein